MALPSADVRPVEPRPDRLRFALPPERAAREPPERRGIARDGVRLLVVDRRTGDVLHGVFRRLPEHLRPGDLLVLNTSRTLPASVHGCTGSPGPCLEARLAERLPDDSWLALLLCGAGEPPACGAREGARLDFGHGLAAEILGRDRRMPWLWRIRFDAAGARLVDLLHRAGRPVRYEHVSAPWSIDEYQTVYATEPGSVEMPSAGRAFTWKLLLELRRRGVELAHVVLHAGLSSWMDDALDARAPAAEEAYSVSEAAAGRIARTRERGGRLVAVGTTVVRALESAAGADGRVRPGRGYTRLLITPRHRLRVVDGLLTGLHEPGASHLQLLGAFLPAERLRRAYEEAVRRGYLWHEFGDLNLIL